MTAITSTVLLKDWDVPVSTVQKIVPLLTDLQVRFAELPTDVSTILETDKKDIKVMPKALQILISHCKSWQYLFNKKQTDSQAQVLPQSQALLLLQTISSDVFKVIMYTFKYSTVYHCFRYGQSCGQLHTSSIRCTHMLIIIKYVILMIDNCFVPADEKNSDI